MCSALLHLYDLVSKSFICIYPPIAAHSIYFDIDHWIIVRLASPTTHFLLHLGVFYGSPSHDCLPTLLAVPSNEASSVSPSLIFSSCGISNKLSMN